MERRIELRPVPSPIQQHRSLSTSLQVVLLTQNNFEGERSRRAACRDREQAVPGDQNQRRSQKRGKGSWILAYRGQESQRREASGERERKQKCRVSRFARYCRFCEHHSGYIELAF